MTKPIRGLTAVEQDMVDRLDGDIRKKAIRNRLRRAYMDGKKIQHRLPPTMPDYIQGLGTVLGWPAKAVEALHDRITLQGLVSPGVDMDLSELFDVDRYIEDAAQGELDALIYGPSFEVVTAGGEGEDPAVISQVGALTATGDWNPRARRLDSLLSVIDRDKQRNIVDANLYLPGLTIIIMDGVAVAKQPHALHVPAEHMPYRPRLDRPFGQSRISRAVMWLTNSACRTIMRSETTADIYGVPGLLLFGPSSDDFDKTGLQMILDAMIAVPDNPDEDRDNLARASVTQLQQGNQTPHVEQLQVWAGLFAGETKIPVSSLGVGLSQANPTSEGSYVASREDIIADAENAARVFAPRRQRTIATAYRIATGDRLVPPEIENVRAVYRDPRYLSQSEQADAAVKFVSAIPDLTYSETFVRTLGWDEATTEGIVADLQRRRGSVTAQALLQARAASQSPVPAVQTPASTPAVES